MEIGDDAFVEPAYGSSMMEIRLPRSFEVSENMSYMTGSTAEANFHSKIIDELHRADDNISDKSTLIHGRSLKVFLLDSNRWQESRDKIRPVLEKY